MKRIYTGWYIDSLRLAWTEECRTKLRQGHRNFLFLLPTRHLIQEVRSSLTDGGLAVSNQVGTFDDIVDIGLSLEKRIVRIDEQAKLTVLDRAMSLAGEQALAPFARIQDKPGFVQSVMDTIEEMKSSGITDQEMAAWGSDPSGYVQSFAAIYRNYQQLLADHTAGRLLDRQEGYRVAAANLQKHGAELLSGIETVYIDFLTVTPLQLPIVEAVCRYVPHVEIFMPYPADAEGISALRDGGRTLIDSLQQLGVEHIDLEKSADSPAAPGSSQKFLPLAKALFREDMEPMAADGIELIPAASALQEVRAVAKEIKRLVRAGAAPADIALITADDATYRPLLRRVFEENEIAVCLADIQNQIENPLIRQFLHAMDQLSGEMRKRYWDLQHNSGFQAGQDSDIAAEWLPAFGQAVAPLVGEHLSAEAAAHGLAEWQADFAATAPYAKHAEAVRSLAFHLQLVEGLYVRAGQGGMYGIPELQRDLRAWQSCQQSLESLVRAKRLYGDREVPFPIFWHEWKEQIYQGKVQVDSGAGAGIRVFRPSEVRGLQFPIVFILGLNEGSYPKQSGDHWLIERIGRIAGKYKRTLQQKEQNELQSLLFRYCLLAAQEKLFIGYLTPEADERNLPSPYLEAVIRAVKTPDTAGAKANALSAGAPDDWRKPARFRSAVSLLPIADSWNELSSVKEWRERLAVWLGGEPSLHLGTDPDSRTVNQLQNELAAWEELFERLAIEEERATGLPSRYHGRLMDPAIHAILRQRFSPEFGWSVSLLNDYAVCPYKFFASRILRIQAVEEAEDGIAANERGIFLHDLAQRLLLPLTRAEQVGTAQAEAVLASYETIFAETVHAWEAADTSPMVTSPFWPAEKERLKREVRLWLEREVNRLVQSRMRPAHLEWSFGSQLRADDPQTPDSASTEQMVTLSVGDEPMRFRGRIDRIDVTEDRTKFAIFDYKTSLTRYKGMQNLEEGTNWQLPVYLEAFREWSRQNGHEMAPLGGGFYKVGPYSEPMPGVWSTEAKMNGITETKNSDVVEGLAAVLDTAKEQIALQRDDLRAGVFDVEPRVACDPYCKYAAVCRFDPTKKETTQDEPAATN